MAEEKRQVNAQMDLETIMMLDSIVAEIIEAGYETDRSKVIRKLIKQEYAQLHPEVVKIEELPRPKGSSHVIPIITVEN